LKPLKIPYKAILSTSGTTGFCTILQVQLALPLPNSPRTKRFEAYIDSGASRCLFHGDFARHLGIDLSGCKTEDTISIGGKETTYLHEISLYIPGGPVTITAGFKDNLPVAGLLGMNGFFEHFRVTFDPIGECCELERIYKA